MTSTWIPVVAGAFEREDGLWLMHKRPAGKHHGGLWEFPGGKVEPTEIPVESLVRELREELGVVIDAVDCEPVGFADNARDARQKPIVILLYRIVRWTGIPASLEGGAIEWYTPQQIAKLDKPPLDQVLAGRLFAGS
ncbi:(deoxy)nucleoside triphosphate pyrophosphohydrolase [Erythrobacter insulae]|uniref:8-oxo-dGTP diphosphatase n=1 Tax=Erythrobacter insulae TaxID=2584124 RepID=A0A547P7E4_9SPHN|nr:(deoxy)nucleoside triphosphate pyrophosphohydrolase [Erythrobacter insulae]TRD10038.1 (deoxy)nucleoside triphosphate pyrophosphohydrolase [Erythrobacter insulae]